MTPLWTEKLSILYEKKYLFEIIPNKNFDFSRKLNSLLRLSIYYSTIVYLFDRKKSNMFYIPFVVAIVTYVLSRKYKETFLNITNANLMNDLKTGTDLIKDLSGSCKTPSKDNPFMNPEIYDYNTTNMETPSCTSYNNKGLQNMTENIFNDSLIRDVNDILERIILKDSFILFQGILFQMIKDTFAKWLYASPLHVKKGMVYNVPQICMELIKDHNNLFF